MKKQSAVARALTVATLVLAVVAAGSTLSGQTEPEDQDQLARGARLYRLHCRNCHGEHGRGDGPMAPVLKTKVPDLTRIAAEHGGEFPAESVHQAIDGRLRVSSHGLREMPVWGLSFQVRGLDGDQEREVQERLRALVAYLESIQRQE